MRRRDYQKGMDVLLWLLNVVTEEELKQSMEKAKQGKFYREYSDEWFNMTIYPEL